MDYNCGEYWQGFQKQMANVFPMLGDDASIIKTVEQSWGISVSSALAACANQQKYFQALDRYDAKQEDAADLYNSKRKRDPYDDKLDSAMKKLPQTWF